LQRCHRIALDRPQLVTQSLELVLIAGFFFFFFIDSTWHLGDSLHHRVWLLAVGLGVIQCISLLLLYQAFESAPPDRATVASKEFACCEGIKPEAAGVRTPLALMGALLCCSLVLCW